MRKKKTRLDKALEFIQLRKEAENYNIYMFLRKCIALKYHISIPYLESSQDYKAAEARMILFYLLKSHTNYSYRIMGILFNIKHHSLIHHAVKLIEGYFEKNLYGTTILATYKEVEKELIHFLKEN